MKKIIFLWFAFIFILLLGFSDAHELRCLSYNDKLPNYVCHHDLCQVCVNDNGYPAYPGYCNKLKPCPGGNAKNDTVPPELNVSSPSNNQIFQTNKILFSLKTDEPCTISYLDIERGKWLKIAGNRKIYKNSLSFKDGLKNITIRAEDRNGNYADISRTFYVDSKIPKIDTPVKENGILKFRFEEANPESIVLKTGNEQKGYVSYSIDLDSCNKIKDGKYLCISQVPAEQILSPYNGDTVFSWLEIKDIAGNTGISKKKKSLVDLDKPVINNPESFLTIEGKYAHFKINISEENFDVIYLTENFKTKKLCSTLKNEICEKRILFTKGDHSIKIAVFDDALNFIEKEAEFTIN